MMHSLMGWGASITPAEVYIRVLHRHDANTHAQPVVYTCSTPVHIATQLAATAPAQAAAICTRAAFQQAMSMLCTKAVVFWPL